METLRKPFQGVWNIVRFNWHFYVGAGVGAVAIWGLGNFLFEEYMTYIQLFIFLGMLSVVITLVVSWYVYDYSGLYQFKWLEKNPFEQGKVVANINAGFDETSALFVEKLKPKQLHIFDFYDPQKHTEVSIKRARKAYPPFPNTQTIETGNIPLEENTIDYAFGILAIHEIRDHQERILFLKELNKSLKPAGRVAITEHLRNLPNFLAYNIGFFHFHSKATWLNTFEKSDFIVEKEIKITPFISTFILKMK